MSQPRGGKGGATASTSSAAATLGSAREYYAAAKAAVDALTVGLAKELAQKGWLYQGQWAGMLAGRHRAARGCRS